MIPMTLPAKISCAVLRNSKGFTMIEVTISVLILTVSTIALMNLLRTGDTVYWRGRLIEKATILAQNEAELLKVEAPVSESIEEKEYEKEIDGIPLIVNRKIIENDSLSILAGGFPIKEIEIQVRESSSHPDTPLVRFKLLQGYGVAKGE